MTTEAEFESSDLFGAPQAIAKSPWVVMKFSGVESNRARNGWGDFELMIATWEQGLGDKQWILGDNFSAADVMLGSRAVFLQMLGMRPESPTPKAYAERCLAREAYKKATEAHS